jgi:hypothetical protein
MRTSETEEISTTERPNFCSVFRFCFFLLLLLFFLLCFLSLFFRSTEQEHKQVSAHWDLFVQNEEHALQTHAKFQIMVAADYGFFLYGAALWY